MTDPFALARAADPGDDPDAEILDLLQQWRAALTAVNAVQGRDADPEIDVVTTLSERIFAAPVSGALGLAVKAYMLAYEVGIEIQCAGLPEQQPGEIGLIPGRQYEARWDWRTDSPSADAALYLKPLAMLGALAAAVRCCPELAPLAAGALSTPRVLPISNRDDADG